MTTRRQYTDVASHTEKMGVLKTLSFVLLLLLFTSMVLLFMSKPLLVCSLSLRAKETGPSDASRPTRLPLSFSLFLPIQTPSPLLSVYMVRSSIPLLLQCTGSPHNSCITMSPYHTPPLYSGRGVHLTLCLSSSSLPSRGGYGVPNVGARISRCMFHSRSS